MKLKFFIVSVCCLWIFQGIVQAQSMYGDAVAADVKMKYVYSLDEALHLAKKENKLIFCNCFEDWAIPCHGMNKKVFSNQEFARWMDGHFINFFIDLNTEEGEKFKSKYNIKFMAHYVVLDAEGNLVHRIVGGSELPEFQKQGIGGELLREAHKRASQLGYSSAVLLGHKDYYPRFGYKKASDFNIEFPFDVPEEYCMAIELFPGALDGVQGIVHYSDPFRI